MKIASTQVERGRIDEYLVPRIDGLRMIDHPGIPKMCASDSGMFVTERKFQDRDGQLHVWVLYEFPAQPAPKVRSESRLNQCQ